MVTLIKYGALSGGEKYNVNQMYIDGLSTDTKPTTTIDGMSIPNGSVFTELDTGKKYMFDATSTTWYEQPSGGGGGGGGGGTSNYNELSNRPQINSTTLTGNKTSSALGLQDELVVGTNLDSTPTSQSDNPVTSGGVYTALGNKVDAVSGKGLSTNDFTDTLKDKLDGIESGAEANVQADWEQIDTTADDYIKGKPTIPTVNDSTITIQKNGTTVKSFTTNQASGDTINITVPTSAADVSALPNTTKYAAALSLTINSSTFVMTGQLKDQNGDNLGTAQTIDLPLESVVVNGSYDSQTKKVVLTLQNGNTIEFSVADLVSGLQTELSASNKLNPAYIDYDSTHAAVTEAQREQISTNQSNISTLAYINPMAIYSLDSKVMTGGGMVIPEGTQVDMNAGNYVMRFVSDTARNGTLVIYNGNTETYRASIDIVSGTNIHRIALNSASDSLKFAISASATITDLTIISAAYYDSGRTGYVEKSLPNTKITPELIELVDSGAKNVFNEPVLTTGSAGEINVTVNGDGTFTLNTSGATTANSGVRIGWFTAVQGVTYAVSNYSSSCQLRVRYGSDVILDTSGGTNTFVAPSNAKAELIWYVPSGTTLTNYVLKPMVCTKAAWDVSQKFVPYRPSYEETVEQVAENENNISLIEALNGQKNMLEYGSLETTNANGVTYTINSDYSVTVTDSASRSGTSYVILKIGSGYAFIDDFCNGDYILSGCPSGGSESTYWMYASAGDYYKADTGSGILLSSTAQTGIRVILRISGEYIATPIIFRPMIRRKELDNTYDAYAMTNGQLTSAIRAIQAQLANT